MPRWLRKVLPFAIGLLVLVYLFTVDNPSSQLFDTQDKGRRQTAPAFFVTDFASRQYDDRGLLAQLIRGVRADHYQPTGSAGPEDYTDIVQLEAEIYQAEGSPWQLRADQGRAVRKGEEITLTGNVRLWIEDPVKGTTELNTETLVYLPKRRLARTDAPVTIHSPDGTTQAVGLTADLNQEVLTLQHKVRGLHEPR